MTRIVGTVHEKQYTFLIIPRSVLVRMKNVSGKSCTENQNTRFVFSKLFFKKKTAIYEITWKNILELGKPQITLQCIHIAQ
jgi:hypothetical protein